MVVKKKVSNTYRLALTVGKSEANNRSNKKVLFERMIRIQMTLSFKRISIFKT